MNRHIDCMEPRIKNRIHRAMILELKAESFSFNGRLDEASSLYRYCLKVFSSTDHPILKISTMNNAAVNYFRLERYDSADEMWTKAMRSARKKEMPWLEAIICMNMGDNLAFNRGQIKRGKDMVRRGRRIMESLKDLEGIADAYFNEALVCVEEGNVKLADRHFLRSMEFPIQDKVRRDERIEVYKDRLKRRGMEFSISLK